MFLLFSMLRVWILILYTFVYMIFTVMVDDNYFTVESGVKYHNPTHP
jgi:hypothetical protein